MLFDFFFETNDIKAFSVKYQREKLETKLNDGSLDLDRTSQWIRDSVLQFSPCGDLTSLTGIAGFMRKAFANLITGSATITAENVPVTLRFDLSRLYVMRKECFYIILASSILTSASKLLDCECPSLKMDGVKYQVIHIHLLCIFFLTYIHAVADQSLC